MKKAIITTVYVVALLLAACTNHSEDESKQTEVLHYQCPMKCEDDKTYTEPGICPVCKMDLKEVHTH